VPVADPLGVGDVHLSGDRTCAVPQLSDSEPVRLRCRDPVPGSSVLGRDLLGQLAACGRDCSCCPARSCPGGVGGGAHAAPPPAVGTGRSIASRSACLNLSSRLPSRYAGSLPSAT